VAVYVEAGKKRVFAGALDWPGWSRSGRDESAALEALVAYAPRYAAALKAAHRAAPSARTASHPDVVERVEGNAGTDFGVPMIAPRHDKAPIDPKDAKRLRALLEASWAAFDAAVRGAGSAKLTTGPRGGGRQLDAIVDHVLGAEKAYLSKLGGIYRDRPGAGIREEIGEVREVFLDTLARVIRGEPAPRTPRSGTLWTPRYAVRRSAWHALDHAWEIEDRSGAGGSRGAGSAEAEPKPRRRAK
jgi:hypothetical protein